MCISEALLSFLSHPSSQRLAVAGRLFGICYCLLQCGYTDNSKPVQDVLSLLFSWRAPQRFLQFRLGCEGLSTAAGCLADPACVESDHRVCLSCSRIAVGNAEFLNVLSLHFCSSMQIT